MKKDKREGRNRTYGTEKSQEESEPLGNDKKAGGEKIEPVVPTPQVLPKVSKVVFDEATGTITLQIKK